MLDPTMAASKMYGHANNFLEAYYTVMQPLCRETGLPPMILLDEEGGTVSRLGELGSVSPSAMALGAAGDPENAFQVGRMLGQELRAVGVNFNCAPILDCNTNPKNPVIGVRSFGGDPEKVADFGAAYARGLREAGVIACGKHFPGHGWAVADSHKALPEDERSPSEVLGQDVKPYGWLGAGLASVMTAHVLYPTIDEVPATFSKRLLQGVLREELGFTGLIFSDDLSMQGAKKEGGIVERAQKALAAGCDALIICNAPEDTDELLAGLSWQTTPPFEERWRRIAPRPAVTDRATLKASAAYRAALEQMKI